MTTHLIHVPLDMLKFNRWAGDERGLRWAGDERGLRWADAGYAFHVLLSAMFGKSVLQPFRLFASERRSSAALYGYADVDRAELQRTADAVAPPDCLHVLDPARMRSKRMPLHFERGRRLGFDLRVRPVRRVRRELADEQIGRSWRKGAEVDAFLLDVIRKFPSAQADRDAAVNAGVTRESVYREWLTERLGDAVVVEQCRLAAVKRTRAVRGDAWGPEGPDATLHGTFTVSNEETFAKILRNGVGRHRAYGYGMLLLRPPSRPAPER